MRRNVFGTFTGGGGPIRRSRPADEAIRDAAWLARLQTGDERALTEFVRAYAERLRDFAYLTVCDADLAADIAQDVFVWLWEHRRTVVVGGTVADYLYRATRNRAINVVRRERAQDRMRARLGAQYAIDAVATAGLAADGELAMDELAAAFDRALRALTPRVRETFLLAHVEHLTREEIAHILSVSVVTVQGQLSRAIKQIRAFLAARA